MKKVAVLGSINIDLVVRVPRFPKPGETLIGSDFMTVEGGKGANQAVALAKLGANVVMFGKVGDDLYGSKYIDHFKKLNMDTKFIHKVENCSTGVACITLTDEGQNSISIVAGANGFVDDDYIAEVKSEIKRSNFLMIQLETPIDALVVAAKSASESGVCVVLDPAPARELPMEIYKYVDYITPNETETEILTGVKVKTAADAEAAAKILLNRGVKNAVIKAGSTGSYIFNKDFAYFAPAFKVRVADTTAAGDTFNAAFVYALSAGNDVSEALLFGNAASAIKIQGVGAQGSMPEDVEDIKNLIFQQGIKVTDV